MADICITLLRQQLQGLLRSIGVSNFGVAHLEKLMTTAKVLPAVNQVELSPYLQRQRLVDYCKSKGILLEVRKLYPNCTSMLL